MSTQDIIVPTKYAATLLANVPSMSVTDYKEILDKSGYDMPTDMGTLLLPALECMNVEVVELLFSRGATTASAGGVYAANSTHHAYLADRRYPAKIADLLLEHTMASNFLDVIVQFLRNHNQRLNVFHHATNDKLRAELYIRCNALPTIQPSAEIQAICAKAGLCYSFNQDTYNIQKLAETEQALKDCQTALKNTKNLLAISEQSLEDSQETLQTCNQALIDSKKRTVELVTETESLKEQLAAVSATFEKQLAAETEKLAKASAIIKKLTDI